MMSSKDRQQQTRQINEVIDRALRQPSGNYLREAARLRATGTARAVAERVRRRSTLLAHRDRRHRAQVIHARDEFILAIYALAAPRDWFTAWSDASIAADRSAAGLGGVLADSSGRLVAQVARRVRVMAPFEAEIAALAAILQVAHAHGAKQLRVYNDCDALVRLWHQKRDDPRLEAVAAPAQEFRRLELRTVPRQHNQPAHRLAKSGATHEHAGVTKGSSDTAERADCAEVSISETAAHADPATRRILHVDMDAFFVAVELLRHTYLKGQPVIVGGRGDPRERGVVSTASYEARRFGVYSGMPLRTALHRCPQARFLPVDYDAYAAISVRIKQILAEFSPAIEDAGIDEAFLDISAAPEPPVEIARAIKQRIREETGLSCSVGIAPNKLLAKIASDLDKPDGLTLIEAGDVEPRIWPLPVRKLWGVGPKTEQRLLRLGIDTIGALAQTPVQTLIEQFGPAHGQYLHQAARGIDDSPLITHWEPKSLSRETTFQRDIGDWMRIRATVQTLARELVANLREQGYAAHSAGVKLRFADFETHTHAMTLPAATDDEDQIVDTALRCLARFALMKKVRLVGVRVAGLSHTGSTASTRAS